MAKKAHLNELEIIKRLRFEPIRDRKASEDEAKKVLKKYFSAETTDRWSLLTPTYREHLDQSPEEWNREVSEHFAESRPKIKIRQISVISGCMVGVVAELRYFDSGIECFGGRAISLVREKGEYDPDPDSPLRIEGKTVPPYVWGTRKK
jgi:hypothetical protein